MRAIEHSRPWPRMQELLEELTVALERLECDQALALLGETVPEYQPAAEVCDYVWTRKRPAALGDGKVADLTAKRRELEQTGEASTPSWQHETPSIADTSA